MENKKDFVVLVSTFSLIAIVVIGFSLKYFFKGKEEIQQDSEQTKEEIAKTYPEFSANALRLKKEKNESFEIIDVRPRMLYEEEHIIDSIFLEPNEISTYVPEKKDTQIIIISPTENEALKASINQLFEEKNYSHTFLTGGFPAWKSIGGNTVSKGNITSFVDRSKVTPITTDDLKKIIDGNELERFMILDVRTESNFFSGHVPGAKNIPLGELERRRQEIPSGRQIITYGSNDTEGFQASVRLFDYNFFSPQALSGGIAEWESKKFPIEKQ